MRRAIYAEEMERRGFLEERTRGTGGNNRNGKGIEQWDGIWEIGGTEEKVKGRREKDLDGMERENEMEQREKQVNERERQ